MIVFAAARSAPGVTTAALAFASVWPGRVLIVEASEDGGALAARFGLQLEPGATTLAAALRRDIRPEVLWSHVQPLPGTDGRLQALVGPPAAESAQAWLRAAADGLAGLLSTAADVTVLVDVGRVSAASSAAPLIAAADRFVLVARPRVEELQTLAARLPVLRGLGTDPELLLVGDKPYGPKEVAATLGCRVLGVLADDRGAADTLGGQPGTSRVERSRLLRSAASLVDGLAAPAADDPAPLREAPAVSWTASGVARHG